MGAIKQYLLQILEECAPENGFAQDAIEHYLLNGPRLPITGDLALDVFNIMDQYDHIITTYRATQPIAA